MKVSAVLVTRGNVDLTEIVSSLADLDEVVVWNNRGPFVELYEVKPERLVHVFPTDGRDFGVYGRYAAISDCRNQVIYVQDDDVVVPRVSLAALFAAHRPGVVTSIMDDRDQAEHPDSALVGFGAVFERELPARAFERFRVGWPNGSSDEFHRICDVAFTGLTPCSPIDQPVRLLPWAVAEDRMWRQPGFHEERARALAIARTLRT